VENGADVNLRAISNTSVRDRPVDVAVKANHHDCSLILSSPDIIHELLQSKLLRDIAALEWSRLRPFIENHHIIEDLLVLRRR